MPNWQDISVNYPFNSGKIRDLKLIRKQVVVHLESDIEKSVKKPVERPVETTIPENSLGFSCNFLIIECARRSD